LGDTAKLPCYVISGPKSDQASALIDLLRSDKRLDVSLLKATMVYADSPEFLNLEIVTQNAMKCTYGRMLLPGELGCSLSHNDARLKASTNANGALILEEDAQIKDLNLFVATALDFLKFNNGRSSVLSFYNNEFKFQHDSESRGISRWVRHLGGPSSTVAYAITQFSALKLSKANTPVRFVADWPIARTRYYIALMDVIHHPEDPSLSSIGNRDQRYSGFGLKDKLSIFLGLYYISNRTDLGSFTNFLRLLWIPRMKNQINRIVLPLIFRLEKIR